MSDQCGERGRPAGQPRGAEGDRDDDAMTVDERRKYLKRMQGRYWAADRAGRGQLLDEMGLVTGLHRRSLVRLLSARGPGLARQPRRRQRARTYGHQVDDALRVIWESLDYICAPRLTPQLVATARQLVAHGELRLSAEVEAQLARISRALSQRRLTRLAQDMPRLPRGGPERASRANAVARP